MPDAVICSPLRTPIGRFGGALRERRFAAADLERLRVNGSGISLGHPVGATGARILATLLNEMARRESRYALETLCIGGGQGIAAALERLPD